MRLFTFFLMATAALLSSAHQSGATVVYDSTQRAAEALAPAGPDYQKIPIVFTGYFQTQSSIEDALLRATAEFRRLTKDGQSLTIEDVKQKEDENVQQERIRQLTSLIRYDLNFDTKVTREEIEQALNSQNGGRTSINTQYISEQSERLMSHDTDGDGVLSYAEMSTLRSEGPRRNHRSSQQIGQYMSMDTNKDGIVTVDELQKSLRDSFAIVDLDGNSVISSEEYKAFIRVAQNLASRAQESRECTVKPVPENVRFVALGNYEGASVPTVTTVGQDKEMSSAEISIKAEGKPLYILLASYDPMLFKFSGRLDKVAHVYVSSDIGGSGVAKIPKEKVTFIDKGCVRSFHGDNNRQTLPDFFGRTPDVVVGQYKIDVVNVYDDRIEYPVTHRDLANVAPEGFDPEAWKFAARFHPAGVMDFDPKDVVSLKPAEKYEVLPSQAGIAKLVHDGVLRSVGGASYEIVKPLVRYPSGLTGAHSVRFILPADMPKPQGSPGHSCVSIRDKSGSEVDANGPMCGQRGIMIHGR